MTLSQLTDLRTVLVVLADVREALTTGHAGSFRPVAANTLRHAARVIQRVIDEEAGPGTIAAPGPDIQTSIVAFLCSPDGQRILRRLIAEHVEDHAS